MDLRLLDRNDFRLKMLTTLTRPYLKDGLILDYGCGNGYIEEYFSSDTKKFIALEKDKKLLAYLKNKKRENVIFDSSDKISNFKPKSFNVILCLDVLEHIQNDKELLKRFFSLLKKNGQLILNVPVYQFLYSAHDRALGHKRRYAKTKFFDLLHKTGFKVLYQRQWNTLGFFATLLWGKVLKGEMNFSFRKSRNILSRILNSFLSCFLLNFETKLKSSPWGISLFVVAVKS